MAKGDYLDRQKKDRQAFFDAGVEIGMQKMWDYVQKALINKEVMSTHVLNRARLEKVYTDCMESADYFELAFTDHKEADCRQEELDGVLREIWEDDLVPFAERYPKVKKQNYNKGKEKWR